MNGLVVLVVLSLAGALLAVGLALLQKRRADAEATNARRAAAVADERMRHAETETKRLRAAVESVGLGILIADRHGTIVFTNPAANAVMSGSAGHTAVRNRVMQLVGRLTGTGVAEDLEFDLHTPERRVIALSAVPLESADGKGSGALVYITDLTERYRIDAVRRDFIANAGHELKTPIGALAVLSEAIAETDDAVSRKRLTDRLEAEALRMALLVDDILDLAAIESLETPHVPVIVADVLAESSAKVAIVARESDVELAGKHPPREVQVSGDRAQLISLVSNLLDNAIKYTDRDGSGGTVWYRAWDDGEWVFIEVEDNGIGIDEPHRDRIFERFYRVDRSRGRTSGGTGLGLSIVRNVARAHGGDVSLVSELGMGSTFTVRLPGLAES